MRGEHINRTGDVPEKHECLNEVECKELIIICFNFVKISTAL